MTTYLRKVLGDRVVDLGRGRNTQRLLPHVAHYADDRASIRAAAYRILIREILPRQGFADQDDPRSAGAIARGEFPALAERDTHGAKTSRGHVSQLRLE